MQPYLILSVNAFDNCERTATLYTNKGEATGHDDGYESYSATTLHQAAWALDIPVHKTHMSRAFCLDVERLMANIQSKATGVDPGYFSSFA
jgi:hypothetical protein